MYGFVIMPNYLHWENFGFVKDTLTIIALKIECTMATLENDLEIF